MALNPVKQTERIVDAVHEHLRNAIFAAQLLPGGRLSVPALAAELGVSRSPVREAVLRLTKEGLAVEEPRRGAVVANTSLSDLIRIYEVREVLEGLAARLVTERQTPGTTEELRRLFHEHEQAVQRCDMDRHIALDMQFHQVIRCATGNPELMRSLEDIQGRVRLAMNTTVVTCGPVLALRDHQKIMKAITNKDADAAERFAREHVARLRRSLSQRAHTTSNGNPTAS